MQEARSTGMFDILIMVNVNRTTVLSKNLPSKHADAHPGDQGAHVIIACRNKSKGEAAVKVNMKTCLSGGGELCIVIK